MKKLSNTEVELEKGVAYKKKARNQGFSHELKKTGCVWGKCNKTLV